MQFQGEDLIRDWPTNPVPVFKRAVFFDRDGTLNVDTHYPFDAAALEMLPGVLDGLKRIAALPIHILVVSNQAGIALGLFTREQMSEFNKALRLRVEENGGRLDAFYFSPDLEPKNLPSGAQASPYSKPAPGMLIEAASDYSVDLTSSMIVGDKLSDVAAGQAVQCKTVLLGPGKADENIAAAPDYRVSAFGEVVRLIMAEYGGVDQ